MNFLRFFRRHGSAPVARDRLQALLVHERKSRNQPDLVALLRDEILSVLAKYMLVDQNNLRLAMNRGERTSTLQIDIRFPNVNAPANVF